MKPVYLDYNASTPLAKEVKETMLQQISGNFGNPSSTHWYGRQMKQVVEEARAQVAAFINCEADEIIFTSGGTESNNLAIKGIAFSRRSKGNHIITSSIEHPAVLRVCKFLETQGFEVTYLPVDKHGLIDLQDLDNSIKKSTILITIMHANNEVGTIQPLTEISAISRKKGIIFHTDAAQSLGKIQVDVNRLGIDLLSIAGHKIYAPQGVGALYIKNGVELENLMFGADHERGIRPGTENVIEIAGLGKACEIAGIDLEFDIKKFGQLTDLFFSSLKNKLPDIRLNGHPQKRLPNTLNISFPDKKADLLLAKLDSIAASAGAACHSDCVKISHVLEAMKVPEKYAQGSIRFSVGRYTTKEEINLAVKEIIRVI